MESSTTASTSTDLVIDAIAGFLAGIGIEVRECELPEGTFLPGISPRHGALLVDRTRLLYPGDLLHEAGHIACATGEQRAIMDGHAGDDPAEEMMAIAWSYAAALHIGIDPAIVLHEHGYHGGGAAILEGFAAGRWFGVPMLEWLGMAYDMPRAVEEGTPPYPAMVRWMR